MKRNTLLNNSAACRFDKFSKTMEEWINELKLVAKVPVVKLLGRSAGSLIPGRCQQSDVDTFLKLSVCLISLLTLGKWPKSIVSSFQRTSRMSWKLVSANNWPNSDFDSLEKPGGCSVVLEWGKHGGVGQGGITGGLCRGRRRGLWRLE